MKVVVNFFDRMVRRFLPDAFLFAILLTLIVFIMGIVFTGHSTVEVIGFWGDGFWGLLDFAMQMTLIVVTGYILANTKIVKKGLTKLSTFANTPAQAVILVTLVASIASLINYGFGLVVGGLMAVYVVNRVPSMDFRLLVASAYSGFLLWHGGLSASAPLLVATDDHFLADTMGSIPVVDTIFSSFNIFIIVVLLVTLPVINWLLLKTRDPNQKFQEFANLSYDESHVEEPEPEEKTPATRLENSQIISMLIGALGLAYTVYFFATNGFNLDLDIVIFIFLFLGIILHKTPRRFLNSISDGVKNAGSIIIQFPFYAGIMGIMQDSGLSESLSLWFVSISNDFTFPLFTFISAGIVNFFVPSGGGQWSVQGPVMIPAALEIGASTAKTTMAVAWGDAWTNMIQPFWALPMLAIAGLKVRDIMGFCAIILIYSFFPIAIGLLFF